MTAVESLLAEPVVKRLGWALLHFVWQGVGVAILFAVGMWALRRRGANPRYVMGVGTLLVMISLPVVTLLRIEVTAPTVPADSPRTETPSLVTPLSSPSAVPAVPPRQIVRRRPQENVPMASAVRTPPVTPLRQRASGRVERILPWAVTVWLIGVIVLAVRLLGGCLQMRGLKRRLVQPVARQWQQTLKGLSGRMRLTRPVRVLESALAQVPTVIGWLKPLILLPTSALTGLSREQLEALLAHELAHIRRHDYVVNLLQTVVETLLFYHPAVWWVSHRVRVERENCCDDLAVAVCGNEVAYARALTEMEQLRIATRRPALAAGGGSLLGRIRRLLKGSARESNRSAWWLAGAVVLSAVVALAGAVKIFCSVPPKETLTNRVRPLPSSMIEIRAQWPQGRVIDGAGKEYGISGPVYVFDPGDPKLQTSTRKQASCDMLKVLGLDFINQNNHPRVDIAFEFRDRKMSGGALFELTLLDGGGGALARERVLELRNRELPSEVHGGVHEIGGDDPPNRFGKAEFRFQDVSLDSAIDAYRLSVVEADMPTLVELLVHKGAYVRSSAARALGQMGRQARGAIAPLMSLLEDRDEHVRGAAEQALQRIRSATPSAEASTVEALAESPRRLTFGGVDLTEVTAMTDPAELPDLFKPGPESGPHVLREGVEIVHQDGLADDQGYLGTVYFVKNKNVFYIRYGPPKWTSNRKYYGPFEGDPREKLGLESNPVWLNRLWVTWMPDQAVVKSVADLGYPGMAAKAIIRGWTPAVAKSSEWEVRTSDNRRRVARIPFAWPNSPIMTLSDGRRIESGRTQSRALRLDRSQLRRLDSLGDGGYLLAWNVGGRRVSNVLRITINASHDIGREPLYRLMEIEPPPGERLPVLGLRAYRRTADDPAPLASAVAYPTLIVDGRERRVTQMTWAGPDAPLKVGGHYLYFLHLKNYSPAMQPGRRHVIVARVDGYESAPLTLTSGRRLSGEWDQATAVLGPAPGLEAPQVILAGKVINTHGKPTRGYEVSLAGKDGFTETVSTNDDGRYAFHADTVPAGEYEVCAHPHARGQPILTVRKVVLDGAQPRELDLNLEWKFSFRGRVTYPDGLPAQGWTVMGTWPSPDGTAEFNDFATADMDGRYMLRAPYEVASFIGWGGKQVRRGVKAGRTDLDFVAPEEARSSAKGDRLVSEDSAGYAKRYRNQGFELEAGFTPDKAECIFGEPMFLTFSVKNLSDKPYGFFVGGDNRGSVRHNNFRIAAVDEKGQPVRDPYSYNHFGGHGGDVVLQAGETYTERLYLGFWCAFEKPGQYTVTCKRTLSQNGAAKYPAAPIVAAFPLRIHPYDRGEMQEVIADLGRKLRRGDKQAVYDATLGLSAIEDEAVIPHLAVSLTKGDFQNRLPAVKALARFSTDATLDALLVALKDPDYVVSGAAGESLRKNNLADRAVDALLDELKSRQPAVRALAARALGYTGVERALDPLLEAMDDPDASVRSAAAEAAGKLGSKKAIALLKARVEGDDMGVRVAAAKGLRALGESLQVEWLTPVIRNTDDINDQNFHESIRLIRLYGGKEAAPALVSCVNFDDPSPRNAFNMFLILAIEHSPDGPKHYSEFFHDPNTDGTPEQIQQNRHILMELKSWLAEYQREERESRPASESSAEVLSETATDDEGRGWGERVNGLRAAFELVPQKESYLIGETVGVRLHVRNVSDNAVQIVRVSGQTDSGHWIVEDSEGQRAQTPRVRWMGRGRKIDRRVLNPGEEAMLEVESLAIVKRGNRPAAKREVYIEKPGPYSFRYHLVFHERTEGDWSGELETGKYELRIGLPSEKGEKTDAASSESAVRRRGWGKPVEGVSCALWPGRFPVSSRVHWTADEVPYLRARLRNDGPHDLVVSRSPEMCELSINGRWYHMLVDVDDDYSPFPPGTSYADITILLDKRWYTKDTHQPLTLSIGGRYFIQGAFVAKPTNKDPGPPIRFVSNVCEVEILPVRKGALVWGETVNGLRAAMEIVPEMKTYWISSWVDIRFHVENMSNRPVRIAREVGHAPDHPSRWVIEDSEGTNVPCYQNSLWHGAGEVDRTVLEPGEAVWLEYLEAVQLGRTDEGSRVSGGRTAEISEPGRYSLRYKLVLEEKEPGDWSGTVETGKFPIDIASVSANKKPPKKLAWREKFDAVYRLDEGEILRHIPEPFIAERADFFARERSRHPNPFQRPSEGPPPNPDSNVFFWDGRESRDYWANRRTLGDILEALELETWEVRMSEELLRLKVQGDWVLRESAPMEQRLRSLAQILKGRFGRSVRFEKRKVEEEVIAVTGKLDIRPVKAERWRKSMLEHFASLPEPALKPIHVYVDFLEKGRFRILYADTDLGGLLRELAERLRLTVIDETESSDVLVGWSMHETFRREYIQEDPSRLEELLQNLSRQTSLRFTRRPQMVERWFVMDEESGSDVPTPVTGARVSAGSGARTAPESVAPEVLVLRCLNAAGKPLAGVHVGRGADGSSERDPEWRFYEVGRGVKKSDDAGRIPLKPSLSGDSKDLLYARLEAEGLVGLLEISRDDLGKIRDMILQPECRVHGRLTSSGLRGLGREVTWTNVYLFAGERRPLGYMSEQQRFEFFLPPGEYRLEAYGTELDELERPIEVRAGERDLEIDMDLPPTRLAKLIGHAAPELQKIKGWKNGGAVRLADLRGKYILLDFWGQWCGPCVRGMPELMLLHEAFGDRGLVIIGVHDDSAESIEEMDAKLAGIRERMWMGRDIPFLVALDGGGETLIEGSTRTASGATTAAYGIGIFPTKVLIDRDGKVVERFHAPSPGEAVARFENLLGVNARRPAWREKFDAIYRLEGDEVLRNVPEPYIPERAEFFFRKSVLDNRILMDGEPYSPGRSVFHWDAGQVEFSSAGSSTLRGLMRALGIREVEMRGPNDLLELEVSGDWVVREDVPAEKRFESLATVLKEKFNRSVRFEKRRIEEEVIVASGRFQLHPLPGHEEDRQLHLYIDQLEEQHGGGTGTVGSLLRYLERIIHKQVANELQSPEDARVVWRTHVSGSRRTAAHPPEMTTLLENLSRQSSLQFRKEKRTVERWFASEVKPDPDPRPGADS